MSDVLGTATELPSIKQMVAAMKWWNNFGTDIKDQYRKEYPNQFGSAIDITRFWVKHFPITSKELT
jgi:hypothetical protein